MNLLCIQGRIFLNKMRSPFKVSLRHVVHKYTNHENIPTSFTHTVVQIMQEISLTGSPSPQRTTSSISLSWTGVTRNNRRHTNEVPIHKQEKFI